MSKFNLADAAKAVLTEGSKETFDANIAAKRGQSGSSGHAPHGEVGKDKLAGSVAHTNEVGDIGTKVDQTTDKGPDATKGTPSATPPGATPPVGSQPASKIKGELDQQSKGRSDLVSVAQDPATDYGSIRDRIKAKLAKQTMPSNPGSTFQSYSEEEVKEEEVVSEEEKGEGHEDEAQDKALIKKMMKKQKMKEAIEDDVSALLSGENLSEEFVTKASTIFEAAVIARTESLLEDIQEELVEQFEESIEGIKEDLASKVDDYLNYMVEEWVKENQIAIQSGLKAEIVEDFITGLKGLFEAHYIDIPTDKVDVVEELTAKVEELEGSLNEQIAASVELKKELSEAKKVEAIHAVCEGLTQTQVEKLKSLAEGVEFTTEEEFAGKLSTLKESYFKAEVKPADSSALDEVLIEEEQGEKKVAYADSLVEAVAKTISAKK